MVQTASSLLLNKCVSEGGMQFSKGLTPCLPSRRKYQKPRLVFASWESMDVHTAWEQKSKTCKHFNLVSTAPCTGSHVKRESSWGNFHDYHAYHNSAPQDIKIHLQTPPRSLLRLPRPPLWFFLQCLWAIFIAFLNSWLDGTAYIGYITQFP